MVYVSRGLMEKFRFRDLTDLFMCITKFRSSRRTKSIKIRMRLINYEGIINNLKNIGFHLRKKFSIRSTSISFCWFFFRRYIVCKDLSYRETKNMILRGLVVEAACIVEKFVIMVLQTRNRLSSKYISLLSSE